MKEKAIYVWYRAEMISKSKFVSRDYPSLEKSQMIATFVGGWEEITKLI